jgi:hypothetical protein
VRPVQQANRRAVGTDARDDPKISVVQVVKDRSAPWGNIAARPTVAIARQMVCHYDFEPTLTEKGIERLLKRCVLSKRMCACGFPARRVYERQR